MWIFYSSTGLRFELPTLPTRYCGGTLRIALDVHLYAMAIYSWVCLLLANILHIHFDVF